MEVSILEEDLVSKLQVVRHAPISNRLCVQSCLGQQKICEKTPSGGCSEESHSSLSGLGTCPRIAPSPIRQHMTYLGVLFGQIGHGFGHVLN